VPAQLDGASLIHGGKEGDIVGLLGPFPAALRAGAREELRAVEGDALNIVDFLGPEAPPDGGRGVE